MQFSKVYLNKTLVQTITVPGKVFIAGEYLALHKGPSLLFATAPRFELSIYKGSDLVNSGSGGVDTGVIFHPREDLGNKIANYSYPFPEGSPAFQLYKQFQSKLNKYIFEFKDPYQGRGGWGASTAQFLALYTFLTFQDCEVGTRKPPWDGFTLLEKYRELSWSGNGYPPSGADLIGQKQGLLTYFDPRLGKIENIRFDFPDLELRFIQTGVKIPTHHHLNELMDFSSEGLDSIVEELKISIQNSDSEKFVGGISNYGMALDKLGFVCHSTQQIIKSFLQVPGVRAVKGCGAMGADIVMIILERKSAKKIDEFIEQSKFTFFLTEANLSYGVRSNL